MLKGHSNQTEMANVLKILLPLYKIYLEGNLQNNTNTYESISNWIIKIRDQSILWKSSLNKCKMNKRNRKITSGRLQY
jgi:hypothetical protein